MTPTAPPTEPLGRELSQRVAAREALWKSEQLAPRIWKKDATVWPKAPAPEVPDRLGWLELPELMRTAVPELLLFAKEVREEGFQRAIVLGMGGSSLAPHVFREVFGRANGGLDLLVLDSTHPNAVQALAAPQDLAKTLFIVSSKSGTTLEPNVLHEFFWHRLEKVGIPPAPRFVAITDVGTALDHLARERAFRRVFNPLATVGGRYSALTLFGLVPAALLGVDLAALLDRARAMAALCGPACDAPSNPGLHLGAVLGEAAKGGRDKATLFVGGALRALPIWVEQLIAESTGKLGKGIVPIVSEPLLPVEAYGNDRLFIEVQDLARPDPALRAHVEDLARAGHPVLQLGYRETVDLGGEFFRWEMGVAASGAVLGIDPFDQPDVEVAKEMAREAMAHRGDPKVPPRLRPLGTDAEAELVKALRGWLEGVHRGDYISLQAYLDPTPEVESSLHVLRRDLSLSHGVATTLGFGPRFLHSTGQLHKGGPPSGVFLQLVDEPAEALEVPGEPLTFREIIQAQALGDAQVLDQRHRRLLRVRLDGEPRHGLELLRRSLSEATATARPAAAPAPRRKHA